MDVDRLREEIRREVVAALSAAGPSAASSIRRPPSGAAASRVERDVVTEAEVAAARANGRKIHVGRGTLITPLARDAAERYGVEIVVGSPAAAAPPPVTAQSWTPPPPPPPSPSTPKPTTAVRRALAAGNPAVMAPRRIHSAAAAKAGSPKPAGPGAAAGCSHGDPSIVALGSDHGGYELRMAIRRHLEASGFQVLDFGTDDPAKSVDYPDFVVPAAVAVARGDACRAIVCDTFGNASAMTVNKIPGVRAAASRTLAEAISSREHNDVNVLCLGGKAVDLGAAIHLVDAFLGQAFAGDRHAKRLDKVASIEQAFCGAGGTP